jgi:hypothetical protein
MPRIHIPDELRRQVIERAQGRCEYCHLHQDDAPEPHHIDRIIAIKHGGRTVIENLALACARCNRYKGSDFAAIDPATQQPVPLFNPRLQIWSDHFALQEARLIGQTLTGRLTLALLRINDDVAVAQRRKLIGKSRYQPG